MKESLEEKIENDALDTCFVCSKRVEVTRSFTDLNLSNGRIIFCSPDCLMIYEQDPCLENRKEHFNL